MNFVYLLGFTVPVIFLASSPRRVLRLFCFSEKILIFDFDPDFDLCMGTVPTHVIKVYPYFSFFHFHFHFEMFEITDWIFLRWRQSGHIFGCFEYVLILFDFAK